MSAGVIYILTNPPFPDYVKIGYANNIERRLQELNRSECIPFAFRVYATYEVNSRVSDKKIHAIIDRLNPNLRSIENFNGQKRVREFYAMSPEDAYAILAAIAEIHGCEDKLKLIPPSEDDVEAAETAEDVKEEKKERLAPFAFSLCDIPIGATIEYSNNADEKSGLTCVVIDDHTVEYDGKKWSLSALATELTQSKWSVAGPRYFKYDGEWLNDIRHRLGR
ncbi:MAG: GIY-YIG nuclease family protein [Firmicutes bacterium]|nr:GIY-YIG nuclease family protein [Bacillota bacterium]